MIEALLLSLAVLVTCATLVKLVLRIRALERFADRLLLDLLEQKLENFRLETRCGSLRTTISDYVAHLQDRPLEPFPAEPASSPESPPGLRRRPSKTPDP